jgi:hypothetical protein
MAKIKVFAPKKRQNELANLLKTQASYDAFVVGEADPNQVEEIKRKFPLEDMSYLNSINLKDKTIDTSKPRFTEKGSVLEHFLHHHPTISSPRLYLGWNINYILDIFKC